MSSKTTYHSRVDSTTSESRPRKRRQNSQDSNSQSSRSRDSDVSPKRRNIFKDKRQNIRQRSISSASSNASRGSISRRLGRVGQNPGYDRDGRRRNFQNGDNFRRGRGDNRSFQQRSQGRFQNNRPYDNQRFNNRFDNRNGRNFQRRDNPMNRNFGDRNRNNRNWNQNNDRRFQNQRNQPGTNWNRSQGSFDRRQQDRFANRPTTGERYWKQSTSIDRPIQSRMPSRNTDSSRSRDARRSRDSHSYEEKSRIERSKSPIELSPEPKPVQPERIPEPEIEPLIEKSVLEKKKKKKRSQSSSSSSSSASSSDSESDSSDSDDSSEDSSSSSSSSSDEEKKKKKKKKLAKKLKKKEKKKRKKKKKKLKKKLAKKIKNPTIEEKKFNKIEIEQDRLLGDLQLEQAMRAKAMAPISKKDWEKRQNVVRRVYHEESGRHRLIKGDGEVIEEIVSRERHRQINNQATRSDGEYFQSQLRKK